MKQEQIELKDWDEINSLGIGLPIPCAASSQAFSVNAFWWRIRDPKTRADHLIRNASAAQNTKKNTLRVAFSRVGWFSRALAFRSLYYLWGKMGDYS